MHLVETPGGTIKEFGQENTAISSPYLKETIAFYCKHPSAIRAVNAHSLIENNVI